jgi:aminopeptidase
MAMASTPLFDERLDAYLNILLKLGVNLQQDQTLVIETGSPTAIEDAAPIARLLVRKAYEMGARHVFMQWDDAEVARTRMLLEPEERLSEIPTWRVTWLEELADQGAAFLNLYAPDSDLYSGVAPTRVATSTRARARAGARLAASAATLRHPWSVASIATRAWARQVYPEKSEIEAVAALWDYIFNATRINQADPLGAWRQHLQQLNERTQYLNTMRFRRLHYRAPGTDLRIALPERQVWIGGGNSVSAQGIAFVPNLPTEEVFSLPMRTGVEGAVSSTMPLNYNGNLIEGIQLRFEEGRIVEFDASKGRDLLETIIETDEGSRYLGEVALVPVDSPTNTGVPVRNTLFDENASCHLAIGRAYPICLEGGAAMSPEDLAAHGANTSLTHVDFMVGSDKLDIDGETASGELIPIFRSGMWVR